MTVAVTTGRVATVIRSHDITEVNSTTVLLGLQVRKDTLTIPPLFHVTYVGNFIRARHVIGLLELVSLVVRLGIWLGIALRMVEAVVGEMRMTINLLLELVSLVVRLGIWPGIALRMVETVVGDMRMTINLLLRGEYFLRPRIRQLTLQSDHEYQNCPLHFDDKIRFANLLPLEMSDFDISLGINWLTVHHGG
ncbi:hypothetical protein Tco_1280743 [Tanacetum coccineum]